MKKKLFLLIICFVLFSSVTAFFVYRKRQLAEIARKEEERKRQEEEQKILEEERKHQEEERKRLEEQKEKNNPDQEKKKENEGSQEETDDDLPWMYNLAGMLIDLIISFFVTVIIFRKIAEKNSYLKTGKNCAVILTIVLFIFIFIFFYIVVFPLIFAIKKYRNKSYEERFKLICKKFCYYIYYFLDCFYYIIVI